MTRQRPPSANELASSAVGGSRERQVRQGIGVRPQQSKNGRFRLAPESERRSFVRPERTVRVHAQGWTYRESIRQRCRRWHQRMNETSQSLCAAHSMRGLAPLRHHRMNGGHCRRVLSRSRPSDGPAGAPNGGTADRARRPGRRQPAPDGGPPTSGRVGARRAADLRDLCLRRLGCVLRRLRGLLERGRRGTDRELPRPALEAVEQPLRGQVELDRA